MGRTTAFTYDSAERQVSRTDPKGNAVSFDLDPGGQPEAVTLTEVLPGEGAGQVVTTTSHEYDALGREVASADPLGNTTLRVLDARGRARLVIDPEGFSTERVYDSLGRLLSESLPERIRVEMSYDPKGNRTSYRDALGNTTARTYDSLSRLTSETTAGKTVVYELDDAGSLTALTYPSGVTVSRSVDALGRLDTIPGVADYAYRGPDLVAEKAVGAISGTTTYDGSRRPTRYHASGTVGTVFDEHLSWSPRSLQTGIDRPDTPAGATGLTLTHDGAGRLLRADRTAGLPPNNAAPSGPAAPTGFAYTYDAAQNLLARSERTERVEETVNLPLEGSGRNRPGAIDGTPLAWDPQGNLAQKGDLHFQYDYRNRLTRVTNGSGTEMARYTYDALNRRIAKTADGTTEETAWAGWQALERYDAGQLAERRTYGPGLDEIVRLETDLDGDGTLEQSYTPVYDHTGNLTLLADEATGQVVERYRFDPYGERTILVDSTPPAVEQLRMKDGALWLEISEGVNAKALQAALTTGAVTLTDTATSTPVALTAIQPVQEGRQAFRRLVLTPDTPPTEGTTLEFRIEPAALRDAFGNPLAVAYVQSFAWPAADQVLDDTAAPEIEAVRLVDRFVELEVTEEPDLATVAAAVTVDGQGLTWTLAADRYTVHSTEVLAAGGATLTVATSLADLAGTTLAQALSAPVQATESDVILFEAPDPRESFDSTITNRAAFHGLDHDGATGLLYVRNRWLDPALGRFLTPDPLGYVDGPSLFTFAANGPTNHQDPLGLTKVALWYGRGSEYGRGQGFDDLARALVEQARQRGLPYKVVLVSPRGRTTLELESPGYVDTHDDYEIFLVSSFEGTYSGALRFMQEELGKTTEDVILIGHSVGAVHNHQLAERLKSDNARVALFVSVDMVNRLLPSPRSIPTNIDRLLVFHTNPTEEQVEQSSALAEPRGVRSFGVDPNCTPLVVTQEVMDVHTHVDSHPGVHQVILDTVLWVTSRVPDSTDSKPPRCMESWWEKLIPD